nr:hypothetical protein BaRGS_006713 [Batillaria attramentaria]
MGSKPVTAVPGVGNVAGARLSQVGVKSASQLYGQYLSSGNSQKHVQSYLQSNAGSQPQHSQQAARAMQNYHQNFG